MHASRCVELLLKKRARTDLKTKDGRAQLALLLALSSPRMDVIWNEKEYSVKDLVLLLGDKDFTTIKLLTEKTGETAEVAYLSAIGGRIVSLAALLIVAADKVNDAILELRDADTDTKEKTTIYECLIREAIALGRDTTPSCDPTKSDNAEKRKLLLYEIELLQLFGAIAQTDHTHKKVMPPLLRACQAGDDAVVRLLMKTNIAINDADGEGNTALHWSLEMSRGSCSHQTKIVWLLLKHGAKVNQRNKLGLTALHLAAANGNAQALQILLLEDPDAINCKTEMKETPLYFAVKNDCMECAELLLCWGANSEILNLRRQRPIDLAKSQDMRFMLNQTYISVVSHAFPNQQKRSDLLQGDEDLLGTCEELLATTDKGNTTERSSSGTKAEICKYFDSPGGCVRGTNCYFVHGDKELRQLKQKTHPRAAEELKQKFLVGDLPSLLDSESLQKFFAEEFGSVQDAIVDKCNTGYQIQSLKQKPLTHQNLLETTNQNATQAEDNIENNTENDKLERKSWVDRLINGQTKTCSNEAPAHFTTKFADRSTPSWLRTFRKWFPGFLKDKHLGDGVYPLSSLKGDFRTKFGRELDHASLGYYKLSDFIRSFSDLCHMEIVPVGSRGLASHIVLLPNLPKPHQKLLQPIRVTCTPPRDTSAVDNGNDSSTDSKCHQDYLVSFENVKFIDSSTEEKPSPEVAGLHATQNDRSPSVNPRFLQFLKPDPLFQAQPWLCNVSEGCVGFNDDESGWVENIKWQKLVHQQRHLVLEAFSRKMKNSSVFFLREFDFYNKYRASIVEGKCFGCNQQKMLWTNFLCQHPLWCTDCRLQATLAAGIFEHKCVVCDMKVLKIDLIPWKQYLKPASDDIHTDEFTTRDFNNTEIVPTKKSSLIGYGAHCCQILSP